MGYSLVERRQWNRKAHNRSNNDAFSLLRRIVGMVKSPVEGNDIVLLKLEDPVVFSGTVFSVCLSNLKRKVHLNLLKNLLKKD